MEFVVGGHRGSGENLLHTGDQSCTHSRGVRENTLKSFHRAATNGAHFIEFDVQVTADGVAVIFHDDYLVHGSLCSVLRSLVSQVSYADFKKMGPCTSASDSEISPVCAALLRSFKDSNTQAVLPGDRLWVCEEEDEMPTLEELFTCLPPDLGFNIEIKMATSPALERTPANEIERMLDAILPVVQRFENTRPVMLSSFDPDIVANISQRTPSTSSSEVWFLSTCGLSWHCDTRRMSVNAAISFASANALSGIVLNTDGLRKELDAVRHAADVNLGMMTYGLGNNDPCWVRQQRKLGVSGVIVDDVTTALAAVSEADTVHAAAHMPELAAMLSRVSSAADTMLIGRVSSAADILLPYGTTCKV